MTEEELKEQDKKHVCVKSVLSERGNQVSLIHDENHEPRWMDPDSNAPLSLRERIGRRLPQRTARLAKIVCRTRPLEDPVAL